MELIKKYRALLVIAVLVGLAIVFFFYRMGQHDARALADFPAAYQKYDQAIADFSRAVIGSNSKDAPAGGDLERKADAALADLHTKASTRISSLTKNDGKIMTITVEIGDLSAKELDTIKAYQNAAANQKADLDRFARQAADLAKQRQADYARFRELAGLQH